MVPSMNKKELFLEEQILKPITKAKPREYKIIYWNILIIFYSHIAGLYGLYLAFTNAKSATIVLNIITWWLSAIGIVAGSHRLWSHKSYKAKKPLQFFLMMCQSTANQLSVIHWARDHRLHHKYSDTDADPHNATRGFFYSHVGWLMVKKHPEVREKGKTIDVSDLMSNPILHFQHKHHLWFLPLIAFVMPTVIPVYFWHETLSIAWNVNMLRCVFILNIASMINSAAHKWGDKPYDKYIMAAQNRILFYLTFGEGSHNYHHVFPWDYRSDEIGLFNMTRIFIDFCAWIGQAYDLKVADHETIKARVQRTGDNLYLMRDLGTQ